MCVCAVHLPDKLQLNFCPKKLDIPMTYTRVNTNNSESKQSSLETKYIKYLLHASHSAVKKDSMYFSTSLEIPNLTA